MTSSSANVSHESDPGERTNPDKRLQVEELVQELHEIDTNAQYYQFTLTASEDGTFCWSTQTHWVGWSDETERFELRQASLVNPHWFIRHWNGVQESYVVVNDTRSLYVYLAYLGGHALVEKSIAEKALGDLLEPSATARSGMLGFRDLSSVPRLQLQHAPTEKQRMRILKRDHYRCKICGARPADDVRVKLNVHHIRMWSNGGLTEDENLITLCHTCHNGLDPHEEWELFHLLDPSRELADVEKRRSEHALGTARYRSAAARVRDAAKELPAKPGARTRTATKKKRDNPAADK